MDDTSERYLKALAQIERLPEPHLLRYQRQLVERLVSTPVIRFRFIATDYLACSAGTVRSISLGGAMSRFCSDRKRRYGVSRCVQIAYRKAMAR